MTHPDDVLATIARNVDTNLAAHEQIDVESARILDLARLVDEHNDVAAHANALRFETLARRVLDTDADLLIHSAGWEATAAGLTRADKYGLDPADVLAQTWAWRDFGDADDVGAVMSWRIETHLEAQENAGLIEPLPEPGTDTGYYEWAVDRTARNHPDVPDEWRTRLGERADYIDQRMSLRGVELTVERPAWTEKLGPVPADPTAQKTWMRLAAEVDLFRARYNILDTETDPIPAQYQDALVGKNLAARVKALHKSTAIRTKAGTATPAAPAEQLRRIGELARKLEPTKPVADAKHAAKTLTPDRTTPTDKRLDELLRRVEGGIQGLTQRVAERAQNRNDTQDDPLTMSSDGPTNSQDAHRTGPRIK